MWEAVDAISAQTQPAAEEKTIARKVSEFVTLIRTLSAERSNGELYEFGMSVAVKSGVLGHFRAENTPEAQSAVDNIEELLNSMQLFKEQRDAEIRNGERGEEESASVDEWLQSVALLTDMDNDEGDDEDNRNRVTLMTVHSAKGLEYGFVYIAGLEENLFPSQRAMETPDGLEEERRLFYVALTRAKCEATLSYAETRFKWGSMDFTTPSRFLSEIDERYIEADFSVSRVLSRGRGSAAAVTDKQSAVEELRRRFDMRWQKEREGRRGEEESLRRSSSVETVVRAQPAAMPKPTENMRSIGLRRADAGSVNMQPCGYSEGDRVEHPKFGVGVIEKVEVLASDHKLIVRFADGEHKTLLAKFAKLTKL